MRTKGLVWFENVKDCGYYAMRNPKIQEGFLHETYNGYGIVIDEADAGDYCIAAHTMNVDLENDLREKFNISEDVDIDFDSITSTPELEEIEVSIDGEKSEELSEYATKYARENSYYNKAVWFNYWDGSNWQSAIIDCDLEDAVWMRKVTDDDLLAELNAVAEKFDCYCGDGASKCQEIDGHVIGCSIMANDPWACYIDNDY